MIRTLTFIIAILISTAAPVCTASKSTDEFLQGTGSACLAGGIVVGLAALAIGPVATSAAVTATSTTVATTMASTSFATSSVAALLGCGAGAAAAVTYYGVDLTYDLLFGEPHYPLLYPPMEKPEKAKATKSP